MVVSAEVGDSKASGDSGTAAATSGDSDLAKPPSSSSRPPSRSSSDGRAQGGGHDSAANGDATSATGGGGDASDMQFAPGFGSEASVDAGTETPDAATAAASAAASDSMRLGWRGVDGKQHSGGDGTGSSAVGGVEGLASGFSMLSVSTHKATGSTASVFSLDGPTTVVTPGTTASAHDTPRGPGMDVSNASIPRAESLPDSRSPTHRLERTGSHGRSSHNPLMGGGGGGGGGGGASSGAAGDAGSSSSSSNGVSSSGVSGAVPSKATASMSSNSGIGNSSTNGGSNSNINGSSNSMSSSTSGHGSSSSSNGVSNSGGVMDDRIRSALPAAANLEPSRARSAPVMPFLNGFDSVPDGAGSTGSVGSGGGAATAASSVASPGSTSVTTTLL